jgi:hypothetical protein
MKEGTQGTFGLGASIGTVEELASALDHGLSVTLSMKSSMA